MADFVYHLIFYNRALYKVYEENVIEVDPGRKFKCNLCSKLFKGADFVKKHIDYKHSAKIESTTNEVIRKMIIFFFLTKYFSRYLFLLD